MVNNTTTATSSSNSKAGTTTSNFILAGEATFNGMLQGMYIHRFNKNWSTRHMIITSMEPGRSMVTGLTRCRRRRRRRCCSSSVWHFIITMTQLMSSISFNCANFSSRASWDSGRQRVGLGCLQAITQRFALGGEVAYAWRKGEGKAQQGVACMLPRLELTCANLIA